MNILKRLHRAARDTIGYQVNVMRFCPYPAQRHRAVLIITPMMLAILPFSLLTLALVGLGVATLAGLNTVKQAFMDTPLEVKAAWTGEEAISDAAWKAYEDFRNARLVSEALA